VSDENFDKVWAAASPKGAKTWLSACWRTDRGAAIKAFYKAAGKGDGEALAQKMVLAIHSQTKHRKLQQVAGDTVPQPKGIAVWLNKQCWLDEFEVPKSELMDRAAQVKCHCGQEGFVNGLCQYHYDRDQNKGHFQGLYANLVAMGLGKGENESQHDWCLRCKDYMTAKFGTFTDILDKRAAENE
jgi:hypothetical protein